MLAVLYHKTLDEAIILEVFKLIMYRVVQIIMSYHFWSKYFLNQFCVAR